MKIVVDYDLCEANAVCVKHAAANFKVDDKDQLHVLVESPTPKQMAGVEMAVKRCPRRAIKLVG